LLPQLRKLEQAFPEALVVIGVHSGKFIAERKTENIRLAVDRLEVHHPVVNDRQFRIWREYAVSAWPTITVIDASGTVVAQQAGEIPAEALIPVVERLVADAEAKGILDRSRLALPSEQPVQTPGPLRFPAKIVADVARKRLFVADTGNDRVLGITLEENGSAGTIDLVVGGETQGLRDGPPATALFRRPQGLAVSEDTLYVADTENHAIRAIALSSGEVTRVAGTGEQSHERRSPAARSQPVQETQATTTPLNSPWDVCARGESLFIAMAGFHQIWRLNRGSGLISAWTGSGAEAIEDGAPHEAALAQTSGLAVQNDRLYFADPESSAIRWADLDEGVVHTIVGTGLFDFGDRDGVGDRVRLQHPLAIVADGSVVIIADTYNNKIKRLDVARREVMTWLDETAGLHEPSGLALTPTHLYIADTNNHRIVVVDRVNAALSTLRLGTR
jgi:hypothetical protein